MTEQPKKPSFWQRIKAAVKRALAVMTYGGTIRK